MTDPAPWLTQIWDEDEADTRNLTVAGIEGGWESWLESGQSIGDKTGYVVAYEVRLGAARRHIVRHDPAAVLARIAADRKILELHKPSWNDSPHIDNDFYGCLTCYESDLCDTIKLMLEPHASRPGFRDEWRVAS